MKFDIKVDTKQLEKKIKATEEQIKKGIQEGLLVCASEIKQMEQRQIESTTGQGDYTPTGQLKRSVRIMPIKWSPYSASITIKPMASYASFVEEGTGIFNPKGRQTPWVYPVGDGTYVFTKGMPAHHFVRDAYEFYKDKAPVIIQEQIYKCIK